MEKDKSIQIKFLSIFISLFFVLCFFTYNSCVARNLDVKITPVIIDQKARPRDILEFSISIKNIGDSKVRLYAIVNDISVEEGRQEFLDPSLLSKSTSLARWVRINRDMIELWPGEEKDIPLSIEVSPTAKPGKYYAVITFAHGTTFYDAEKRALELNQPQLMLNIEIEEHIIEKAQVKQFQTEKKLFLKTPVKFLLEIENIGNRSLSPQGFIYIYNRKGEEVGTIPINQTLASISPLATEFFDASWNPTKALGQYKARLVARYGTKDEKDLQDTIYFWIIPRWFLLATIGGNLILIFLLISFFFKRSAHKSSKGYSHISTIDIRSYK